MKTMKIINAKYPLAIDYYITDTGDVISGKYNRELSTALDKDGYVKVTLVKMVCGMTNLVQTIMLVNIQKKQFYKRLKC